MRHLEVGQGAAPAGVARNHALGRRRAPPGWPRYEPPARSWLTIRGSVRTKARPDVGVERAVERREARRPASLAGDPFR